MSSAGLITWDAVTGAEAYELESWTSFGDLRPLLSGWNPLPSSVTSYTLTQYYYPADDANFRIRLRARSSNGNSFYTYYPSATTFASITSSDLPVLDGDVLAAISNVSYDPVTQIASWDDVAGADYFEVKIQRYNGQNGGAGGQVGRCVDEFSISNLPCTTRLFGLTPQPSAVVYELSIRAFNAEGQAGPQFTHRAPLGQALNPVGQPLNPVQPTRIDQTSNGGSKSEPEPAKTHRQNMDIANAELRELREEHDIDVCHAGRWPVNGKFMTQGEMHMIIEGALPWGSLGGVDLYGGDKNVISASNPVEICFPDPGYLVIFDARQSPRQLRPLPTYRVGDRTCATVTYPGTVGNVPETSSRGSEGWFKDLGGNISSRERSACDGAPVDTVPTSQESEPVWQPVPVTQCGSRVQADGSVVHVVESAHHCWAIVEACGIFMEDIQRLNPEFGDCRMLHPGDELVVSAPPPSLTDGVSLSAEEIPYDNPKYIEMERRVLLGVARCMRDYAEDHHAVSLAMIKREARKIAEEGWRNRGTDHWTAQLGDGRLIVDRKRTRSLFEDEEAILDSPACVEMGPGLDWTEIHTVIEPVTEEELEALRYAIVDMLRACGVRYAIVEREAPKIAQDALRDGVRDVHDLPAYRAMELGYLHNYPASISPRRARRTECFLLPDDSYLEDWGDHGDKDQLFNEHQIKAAEAQLEAIQEWAVAACDIATTAGAYVVIKGGTISARKIVEETLREAAKVALASAIENAPGEEASERTKIFADFAAGLVEYFPTGPCSAFMVTFEYTLLVDEMVEALENLEEGQGVDDLDVFGEDIYCKIYSTDTVLAKRDPDPNRDGTQLRLDVSDAFSPLATVEHNGEKYYVVLGTRGRGTRAVGGLVTAAVYNKSENRGHAFVPASDIDATDSCKDLPDATSLYAGAAHPQDMVGRQLVDLSVQEVPDAFANKDCKVKIIGASSVTEVSEYVEYETDFALCRTHVGDSCRDLASDNEFVITHYDTVNRRVYVKSLDDDGKPEGWLGYSLHTQLYTIGAYGRLKDKFRITNHWVDPYHFKPEDVTEGSMAFGNPALCLPGETS